MNRNEIEKLQAPFGLQGRGVSRNFGLSLDFVTDADLAYTAVLSSEASPAASAVEDYHAGVYRLQLVAAASQWQAFYFTRPPITISRGVNGRVVSRLKASVNTLPFAIGLFDEPADIAGAGYVANGFGVFKNGAGNLFWFTADSATSRATMTFTAIKKDFVSTSWDEIELLFSVSPRSANSITMNLVINHAVVASTTLAGPGLAALKAGVAIASPASAAAANMFIDFMAITGTRDGGLAQAAALAESAGGGTAGGGDVGGEDDQPNCGEGAIYDPITRSCVPLGFPVP